MMSVVASKAATRKVIIEACGRNYGASLPGQNPGIKVQQRIMTACKNYS